MAGYLDALGNGSSPLMQGGMSPQGMMGAQASGPPVGMPQPGGTVPGPNPTPDWMEIFHRATGQHPLSLGITTPEAAQAYVQSRQSQGRAMSLPPALVQQVQGGMMQASQSPGATQMDPGLLEARQRMMAGGKQGVSY